jgi:hypothetical protein
MVKLTYLILIVQTIKKDWIDYLLSGTTLSGFMAFQQQINNQFYWIPVSVGILTVIKLSLDIFKSIKNLKSNKKKKHEDQDN